MTVLSTKVRPTWEIYAHELAGRKFGHPMWYADPAARSGPIQLGDIGFFERGRFRFLFNCMHSKNDVSHTSRGERLPEPFEPFEHGGGDPEPEAAITTKEIYSLRTYRNQLEVRVNGGAGAVGGEAGAEHDQEGTLRASLRLQPTAFRKALDCRGRIEEYVARNCKIWVKSFGDQKLARKDIVFVYGFTTTSRWEATAWEKRTSEDRFSLRVLVQSLAGAGGMVGFADTHDMDKATNKHPNDDRHPDRAPGQDAPQSELEADRKNFPADQCIFLDFYRAGTLDVVAFRAKTGMRRFKRSLSRKGSVEKAQHPAHTSAPPTTTSEKHTSFSDQRSSDVLKANGFRQGR